MLQVLVHQRLMPYVTFESPVLVFIWLTVSFMGSFVKETSATESCDD
jgi:hypothetical protein